MRLLQPEKTEKIKGVLPPMKDVLKWTPKQIERVILSEKKRARQEASLLSQETILLLKSFIEIKLKIDLDKEKISKEFQEFCEEKEISKKSLEESIKDLERKRDEAMNPLYKLWDTVKEKEESVIKREVSVLDREDKLKIRETETEKLYITGNELLSLAKNLEKTITKRETELTERETEFKRFRQGQEWLFKENQAKLRAWFEKQKRG